MLTIEFTDKTQALKPEHAQMVQELLAYASDYLNLGEQTEMSVTIVDDEEIHEINKTYRGVDRPTDVISFAINDEVADEFEILELPEGMPYELGDLFISLDRVKAQAEEYGHSFERELGFLTVHGFLHLNGYDHMTDDDEKEMFALQREILDNYGLKRSE
ncbi:MULTISPECIES: rRNA maturation RNase YbeY [Aerococcus]|uniref:Endoribonuclease YbeY n=1 Tax=Aerococcus sanguinicola TaxID=119206 RepID=A0A5N1GP87_9LACT|nr:MULTISPECIES: rRNA maturation RNase YbeY [Aerococcus]KAA9301851.1 rRNA maturation RNase YbeY [Aerococcus sanguinicola]MDK6368727.1 rRNA maturation RNase YbeY [Aerococcus sp. UMB9870]MDK6679275.1 rRNA maturation RNase YbeY [Aerococcus sp. UMB8608]MDK6685883.1 rRNA maturation RNase YbeY [Aerococcus sp. UMB8623]MDK6939350.1 rRNA maturation RNase YbeY [Aerococcus sp. UMB8487]